MSHNTGECKVNSPIECECIEIDFDQYNQFSQWSKNGVMKIKGEKNGLEECDIEMCVDCTYFPYYFRSYLIQCDTI